MYDMNVCTIKILKIQHTYTTHTHIVVFPQLSIAFGTGSYVCWQMVRVADTRELMLTQNVVKLELL